MDTKFKTSELIEYLDELLSFHRTNVNSKHKDDKLNEIKRILLEDEARRNYANHLENFETDGVSNYIPDIDSDENELH
jgi:hypothetical protein